jgi:hypothetical protein
MSESYPNLSDKALYDVILSGSDDSIFARTELTARVERITQERSAQSADAAISALALSDSLNATSLTDPLTDSLADPDPLEDAIGLYRQARSSKTVAANNSDKTRTGGRISLLEATDKLAADAARHLAADHTDTDTDGTRIEETWTRQTDSWEDFPEVYAADNTRYAAAYRYPEYSEPRLRRLSRSMQQQFHEHEDIIFCLSMGAIIIFLIAVLFI